MKHLYSLVILIATVSYTQIVYPLHCDNDLIREGDSKLVVTMKIPKCGEIIDKQVIKSQHSEGRKREEWLVRVYQLGHYYCYLLKFKEGVLDDIEYIQQCD
jgi:hypothetical protein